jgi:hypothetical protein
MVLAGDVAQEASRRLGIARLSGPVHGDQAELHPVATVPFEIVECAPVDVALERDAAGDERVQRLEALSDELDALGVVFGGDAVLGNDDRLAGQDLGNALHSGGDGLRPDSGEHRETAAPSA